MVNVFVSRIHVHGDSAVRDNASSVDAARAKGVTSVLGDSSRFQPSLTSGYAVEREDGIAEPVRDNYLSNAVQKERRKKVLVSAQGCHCFLSGKV